MQPKLINFVQSETYEIPELLQLDLPQSEVYSPRYKIMKVTRSAEFTDSDSSNVSSIAPGIYPRYGWIFERNSLMKFKN
jgi:hypothetical protein